MWLGLLIISCTEYVVSKYLHGMVYTYHHHDPSRNPLMYNYICIYLCLKHTIYTETSIKSTPSTDKSTCIFLLPLSKASNQLLFHHTKAYQTLKQKPNEDLLPHTTLTATRSH